MAKQIARLLKADMGGDLREIAKMLSKKGRGGDTMLAHITPKEAKILKESGGAGTVNPDTGLLEFYDWSGGYGTTDPTSYDTYSGYTPTAGDWSGYSLPVETPSTPAAPTFDYSGAGAAAVEPAASFAEPAQTIDYSQLPYTPFAGAPAAAEAPAQQFGVSPITSPAPIAEGAVTPTQPGLSQKFGDILSAVKAGGGDVLEFLKKNPELIRLAGAGAGAVAGAQRTKQLEKQAQQATQEQKQLASPYQKAGQEMQRAALSGELTPQSAQAYQALRAQMAQGVESRGGVGVAQAQAQLEAFRQNLLQNQYNYGLQVAQIGDQYAIGAIRTGLQLDQNIAAITNQFYSNLATIAGGVAPARPQS